MLCTPCSLNLHSLCGVMWYRTWRAQQPTNNNIPTPRPTSITCYSRSPQHVHCLGGLAVKASALMTAHLVSNPAFLLGRFFRLNHTSDLKTGTPVATLQDACHYMVSADTGWPGISAVVTGRDSKFVLQLLSYSDSMNTCLRYSRVLLGPQPTHQQQPHV